MRVLKMVKPLGACSKSQPVLKITADKWHLPAQTAEALRSAPFRAYQLRISSCTESCLHHFQTTRRFHLLFTLSLPETLHLVGTTARRHNIVDKRACSSSSTHPRPLNLPSLSDPCSDKRAAGSHMLEASATQSCLTTKLLVHSRMRMKRVESWRTSTRRWHACRSLVIVLRRAHARALLDNVRSARS